MTFSTPLSTGLRVTVKSLFLTVTTSDIAFITIPIEEENVRLYLRVGCKEDRFVLKKKNKKRSIRAVRYRFDINFVSN